MNELSVNNSIHWALCVCVCMVAA